MQKLLTQANLSIFAAATQTFSNISYTQHPEDQILDIVREKRSIYLCDLPKHLRRTSKWTLSLEKQGFIKRIRQKERGDCKRILLVYCETESLICLPKSGHRYRKDDKKQSPNGQLIWSADASKEMQ
jgi:hypothetical protein